MSESILESTSIAGQTVFSKGSTSFLKYFDTGSGKWERWSGSNGIPFVQISPEYTNSSLDAIKVDLVGAGTVTVTGSTVVDARQSGSWNITGGSIGITGSSTLNVAIVEGMSGSTLTESSITGSIGLSITGSTLTGINITVPVTGSLTSLSGGSIGITGSSTLPVSMESTAVSGSIGITGSTVLDAEFSITDVSATLPVTGSIYLTDSSGSEIYTVSNRLGTIATPCSYIVSRQLNPNASMFVKMGHVSTVVNVEQDIWTNGGKYVFPTTTGSMRVQSTSELDHSTGSGIQTIRLGYLDGDYVSHSEIIALSGSVPVPTVATDIYRVNSIRAVTTGTGLKAAGIIKVSGSSDSNIYRTLSVGETRGRSLIYTVPTGSTVYITKINLSSSATSAGHFGTFKMRATYDDVVKTKVPFMEPWFEVTLQDQAITYNLDFPVRIPETCDIVGSIIGDASNSNLVIYGSWRGWVDTT